MRFPARASAAFRFHGDHTAEGGSGLVTEGRWISIVEQSVRGGAPGH